MEDEGGRAWCWGLGGGVTGGTPVPLWLLGRRQGGEGLVLGLVGRGHRQDARATLRDAGG